MKTHAIKWIALVCVLLFAGCSGPSTTTAAHHPITPGPSVPLAGTISATISGLGALTGHHGYGMAADDTAVWIYNGETGNLLRIDAKTNTIVATIPVGQGCNDFCGGVAIGQGAVWVVENAPQKVVRVDPTTNRVVASISVPTGNGLGVFATPGAVWVTDFYANTVYRIDPQTNKIIATLANQPGTDGVAFVDGSLWLCEAHRSPAGLVRLNPTSYQVQAQTDVSNNQGLECIGLVVLDHAIWVAPSDGGTSVLERIDPATNQVSATGPIPGAAGTGFAADTQGEWELDLEEGLSRFAAPNGQLVGMLSLRDGIGLVLGAGAVWVVKIDGTLLRISPAS